MCFFSYIYPAINFRGSLYNFSKSYTIVIINFYNFGFCNNFSACTIMQSNQLSAKPVENDNTSFLHLVAVFQSKIAETNIAASF